MAETDQLMRRALLIAAIACAGCHSPRATPTGRATLTSASAPAASPPSVALPDVATLTAKASPSVVNITATQQVRAPAGLVDPFEFFFGGRSPRGRGDEILRRHALGSGILVDEAGHVVTNAHVVENANAVRVTLADERAFDAIVKGRDALLDVAVLELRGAHDLPHAPLGSSSELRVGDFIVAIGNPFGLGNTVTMGIVSAKGRELGAGPYDDFIQTDASINPGNSGGPLFDLRGQVVGISTAIVPAGQGIGFAIPIDAVKEILPQLLEKGSVARGRLGVGIQNIDAAIAKALGLPKPQGALVAEVEPGGPAAKAGIEPGDVIVRVDGAAIERGHDLPRIVARHAPGTRVAVELIGANKRARSADVTLEAIPAEQGTAPSEAPPAPPPQDFGLSLGDSPNGVVVRGVDPASPVAEILRPGDVVLEVNGRPVRNAGEAMSGLRATAPDAAALVRVRRDGHTRFVAVERQ